MTDEYGDRPRLKMGRAPVKRGRGGGGEGGRGGRGGGGLCSKKRTNIVRSLGKERRGGKGGARHLACPLSRTLAAREPHDNDSLEGEMEPRMASATPISGLRVARMMTYRLCKS